MNENDEITEEYSDEETQGIPTNDKRRFNARGERIDSVEEMPKEAESPPAKLSSRVNLKLKPSAAKPPKQSSSACRQNSTKQKLASNVKPPICARGL